MDRVRIAARAAGGVFVFFVLRAVVGGIVATISLLTSPGLIVPEQGSFQADAAIVWPGYLFGLLGSALPFSVGVFLAFWLIVPLRSDLRATQVLVRGAIGSFVGAFSVAVLTTVVNVTSWIAPQESGEGLYGLTPLRPNPIDVYAGALGSGVASSPLVMLAAVLLWGWPRWRPAPSPRSSAADPVVHFEIIGRDPAALRRFYERVFDWEADTDSAVAPAISDDGEYGFVSVPDGMAGIPGGIGGGREFTPHAIFYIDVDDVGAALGRVRAAGGSSVLEPVTRSDGALVVAHFTDPEGNLVGLAGPR